MKPLKKIEPSVSVVVRYRAQWTLIIAIAWTLIDLLLWLKQTNGTLRQVATTEISIRIAIVFTTSLLMGYLLMFRLRPMFRNHPLIINIFFKTVILVIASFLMIFLLHMIYSMIRLDQSISESYYYFLSKLRNMPWLWEKISDWVIIFIITQLVLELNEKYAPGVFIDILFGRYLKPRIEKRVILFLDLKDSTPAAEQLGSTQFFNFIRDFIYTVSLAMLEYNGRIHQYVGDEIVVTWPYSPRNALRCINALIAARREIQKRSEAYRRTYRIIPEFWAGVHVGEVTVGEIGIIKKDLAISGDTMNTAARICSACAELNHKFIVSKDFIEHVSIADWQAESLGVIDLKGKRNDIELFALKI